MPSISGYDESPRLLLLERRRSISLPFSPRRRRLGSSYQKLPTQISIKLSVLKLDGSSFDVQIKRNATVAELKQAVEDVFTISSMEGQGLISWSHVWGHFCLCYDGQKLINDKDYIMNFQIMDGDQLHFIRHLSINYNRIGRRSKKQNVACQKNIKSLSGSEVHEEKEHIGQIHVNGDIEDVTDNYFSYEDSGDGELIAHQEFKFARYLKGLLSCSRICILGRSHRKCRPSRFSGKFIKLGSKLTLTRV